MCDLFKYDSCLISSTGVEADEIAIKIAMQWGYKKKGIEPFKAKIVFPRDNFWGRTIAASGSSNDPDRYHNYGPFGLGTVLVDFNNIDQIEGVFKSDPNIAAYLVEPIQGEGGVVIPDDDYLPRVRELCDKYEVLLILDEI